MATLDSKYRRDREKMQGDSSWSTGVHGGDKPGQWIVGVNGGRILG
jgi:hypothetical protein